MPTSSRPDGEWEGTSEAEFLEEVSRQARTCLDSIIGYSEMLVEDLGPHLPSDALPVLERIRVAGEDLLQVVATLERQIDNQRRKASEDVLTGVPNRRHLSELGRGVFLDCRAHGRSFSALVIDLDGFKAVNDTYGHLLGDQVLKHTAARLGRVLRRGDHLARVGGDEFVILLPDAGLEEATAVAGRLGVATAEPILTDVGPIRVAASVGVAEADRDTETLEKLIARADAAMYDAKRAARDTAAS